MFLECLFLMFFYNVLGVIGKVDFSVRHLSSATTTFPTSWQFSNNQPCIGNTARQVILEFLIAFLVLVYRSLVSMENIFQYVTYFPFFSVVLIGSAQHIQLMRHLRRHGPCERRFQNMLLLSLQLLGQCSSRYEHPSNRFFCVETCTSLVWKAYNYFYIFVFSCS